MGDQAGESWWVLRAVSIGVGPGRTAADRAAGGTEEVFTIFIRFVVLGFETIRITSNRLHFFWPTTSASKSLVRGSWVAWIVPIIPAQWNGQYYRCHGESYEGPPRFLAMLKRWGRKAWNTVPRMSQRDVPPPSGPGFFREKTVFCGPCGEPILQPVFVPRPSSDRHEVKRRSQT